MASSSAAVRVAPADVPRHAAQPSPSLRAVSCSVPGRQPLPARSFCSSGQSHGRGLASRRAHASRRPEASRIEFGSPDRPSGLSRGTLLAAQSSLVADGGASGLPVDLDEPLHPQAVKHLYVIYFLNCLLERGWRFAQPLLLAQASGGFGAIAVLGLIAQLSLFATGPSIGLWMDKHDRSTAVNWAILVQTAAIVVSVLLVQRIIESNAAVQQTWMYPALILASIFERVSAFASDISLERDWVVAICGARRTSALAEVNGRLRQGDQISEFGAALAVGYCITQFSLDAVTAGTIAVNAAMAALVVIAVQQVVGLAPRAMQRSRRKKDDDPSVVVWQERADARRAEAAPTDTGRGWPSLGELMAQILQRLKAAVDSTVSTWAVYFKQRTVITSWTQVVLYFNCVLAPGGLMTAYLTLVGCSGTGAAVFRSSCAVLGFIGTVVGSYSITRIGPLKTGMAAVCWQAMTLVGAGLIFFQYLYQPGGQGLPAGMTLNGIPVATIAFCALIVLSRIGLWMFDMAHAQIIQQHVHSKEISTVGGVELSFCSLAELCTLGLAAVIADRDGGFATLVFLSCVAVMGAAILFSSWVLSGRADIATTRKAQPTCTVSS